MSDRLNKPVNKHLDNAVILLVFFAFAIVFTLILAMGVFAYNSSRNRAVYVSSPAVSARLALQKLARQAAADAKGDAELQQLLDSELTTL